jgi:DNA-binding response OmpR family regulator
MFADSAVQLETKPTTISKSTQPATILVDEDDTDLQQVLAELLTKAGHKVYLGNGSNMESMLNNKTYDLIITRLKMPGLRGIDGLALIKQASPDRNVCYISAVVGSHLSTAIDAYIAKPFHPAELLAKVRRLLQSDLSPDFTRQQSSSNPPPAPGC